MNPPEDLWLHLRVIAFTAWVCSILLACALLVRANSSERHRLSRGGAIYLIGGVLGIVAAVALVGQHYSYTDVVLDDRPLGFDVDFMWRHGGLSIIAAWWAPRLAARGVVRTSWVVVLAAAYEILRRSGDAALILQLGGAIHEVEWFGAVLPPVAAAIGLAAWVVQHHAAIPSGA